MKRIVTTEQPQALQDGVERLSFPTKDTNAFRHDGMRIAVEQLAKDLRTASHVFASEYVRDAFLGLDPYYQSTLRPDMIFLQLPETFFNGSQVWRRGTEVVR